MIEVGFALLGGVDELVRMFYLLIYYRANFIFVFQLKCIRKA